MIRITIFSDYIHCINVEKIDFYRLLAVSAFSL
jgi:hypothetical protein